MIVTDQPAEPASLQRKLDILLDIARAERIAGIENKLVSLKEKLSGEKLHLAVLGQMKRGKSSLINALLKADALPTGVLPVTAIITEIRYGETPCATIIYTTGGLREEVAISSLEDYISEARNPGNKKQVASVEITYPSPFLKDGIILIDTPGIGSTHAHNTETTESYLNQVDAGIVVLSVDPPITQVESQFIANLKDEVPKLFFILNKVDLTSPKELSEIIAFLKDELDRLNISAAEIFPLSARQGRDDQQPSSNGLPAGLRAFEQRLQAFLLKEKRQVLVCSVAGDTLETARTLRFAASIRTRTAALSAGELEKKREALDQILKDTEMKMRELQVLLRQRSADILAGVEHDLSEQVEAYAPEVRSHLKLFQAEHPKAAGRAFGTLLENWLMNEVEDVFRRWKIQQDEKVQAQLDMLSSYFVDMANGILDRLERAAGALFEIPVQHLRVTCPLRAESHLYYKVERVFYSLDSFLLLLPGFLMRPIVFRRMNKNVPELLDMNAGRVRFDYLERLQASLNRFEHDLRSAIVMVADSLRAALSPASNGPASNAVDQPAMTMDSLDAVIRECSLFLQCNKQTVADFKT